MMKICPQLYFRAKGLFPSTPSIKDSSILCESLRTMRQIPVPGDLLDNSREHLLSRYVYHEYTLISIVYLYKSLLLQTKILESRFKDPFFRTPSFSLARKLINIEGNLICNSWSIVEQNFFLNLCSRKNRAPPTPNNLVHPKKCGRRKKGRTSKNVLKD